MFRKTFPYETNMSHLIIVNLFTSFSCSKHSHPASMYYIVRNSHFCWGWFNLIT